MSTKVEWRGRATNPARDVFWTNSLRRVLENEPQGKQQGSMAVSISVPKKGSDSIPKISSDSVPKMSSDPVLKISSDSVPEMSSDSVPR